MIKMIPKVGSTFKFFNVMAGHNDLFKIIGKEWTKDEGKWVYHNFVRD